MRVSEIEGDAVLFYSHQSVPVMEQLFSQARKMFINFHTHLKRYERDRICQCGACRSASGLTLKIVAHAGKIGFTKVKTHLKPHGSAVILLHRLLKNNLESHEYLLLTSAVPNSDGIFPAKEGLEWVKESKGSIHYEDMGRVEFTYFPLRPLHRQIQDLPARAPVSKTSNPVICETYITCPPSQIHQLLVNLQQRPMWNKRIKAVKFDSKRINRSGTTHVCVLNSGPLSFETLPAYSDTDTLVYGEKLLNNWTVRESTRYYLLTPEEKGTKVLLEMHYPPWPLTGWLLDAYLRRKFERWAQQELKGLKEICEKGNT
jgi:hypothetical protein